MATLRCGDVVLDLRLHDVVSRSLFLHIFILLAGVAFSKWLMAIKDPHHHVLFDPDKSGGGGSFSEFVGGQAGISPCHRSPHQRDDRQPQAAAVLLIV